MGLNSVGNLSVTSAKALWQSRDDRTRHCYALAASFCFRRQQMMTCSLLFLRRSSAFVGDCD